MCLFLLRCVLEEEQKMNVGQAGEMMADGGLAPC